MEIISIRNEIVVSWLATPSPTNTIYSICIICKHECISCLYI